MAVNFGVLGVKIGEALLDFDPNLISSSPKVPAKFREDWLKNVTVGVPTDTYTLGMYRIAIFKIRPEPDSTGYQTNYPAGTGYLDTCCIIAIFLVYFVV